MARCQLSLLTFILIGVSVGCGSTSTTVLSPSPLAGRCGVTLDVNASSIGAAGGTGTVRVQTERECAWNIPPLPSWVKLSKPVTAQGAAEITFVVEENRSTSLRSWEVVVADQRAVISQEAAICTWSLSPAKISIGATGGDAQAVLTTEEFCSWELKSPASWIDITPDRGKGTTEITLRVERNTGGARAETMNVSGAVLEVTQRDAPLPTTPPPGPVPPPSAPPAPESPVPEPPASIPPPTVPPSVPNVPPPPPAPAPEPCSYTLKPGSFSTSASGASVSVSLNSPAGCTWTVTGAPGWVTVSPASGTGSATLKIAAGANSGSARTAELLVGGREFRVEQAQLPACTYVVTPDRLTLSRKKHKEDIEVATQPHCQWSATSGAEWVSVPSGTTTGTGKIEAEVDKNSRSDARSAVVIITGQNFSKAVTVTQGSAR